MEEIDLSEPGSRQGEGEKRNVGRERAPAVVVFTSTNALWATFALIYVVGFLNCLVGSVVQSLTPYVMSDFSGHSILSVLTVVVQILSGVLRLPIAKFIDEYGRARGFLAGAYLTILGLSIEPLAQSLTTTIFAHALHGLGWSWLDYVLTIILADMTSLKNRRRTQDTPPPSDYKRQLLSSLLGNSLLTQYGIALVYGVYVTPLLITSFPAPNIAEQLYSRFGWRMIFAFSAVILFVACIPLSLTLFYAQRSGRRVNETGGNTATGKHISRLGQFAVELDLPGIILAITGLLLFLLPFTHPPGALEGWPVGTFVTMTVLGVFNLVCFALWEKKFAPATCVPWRLLGDRNVLGGCLVAMFSVASIACWTSYYSSYIQVVHDQTIATAGYVVNAHPFAFALSAPVLGLTIRLTGNYKFPGFIAAPILGISTGLLLVFHEPDAPFRALIMCQVFIGCAMRLFVACSQMSVMANIDHKDVALALGIWGTFLSIAIAIGSGNSGAVWTRAVPRVLEHALPADSRNLTEEIAGSLVEQKQYPMGSLIRDAVIAAYWAAQEQMVILAICFVPVAFACVFMWKRIDVRKPGDQGNTNARGVIW